MRDRSSRLARALMVAGASVFILVGAVFGANALTKTGQVNQPAVTSETPAVTPAAGTPEPAESTEPAETTEAQDPAEAADPAEGTEPTEAPDPAATSGTDTGGQDQGAGDSDGSGGAPDSD